MPVEAVPAATVILVRNSSHSPEVLMLERHSRSAFLPDAYVFPGGRVDDADRALADRVTGLTTDKARRALAHVDPKLALAFFVAAIRETFEESGLLLARRRGSEDLLDPDTSAALGGARSAVAHDAFEFERLVLREDLILAGDRMAVHAHWITPEESPKRYDTIFFCAEAPRGQRALHDGVEVTNSVWIRPEDALEDWRRGERQMIQPTWCNLETISGFAQSHEIIEMSRGRPVMPVVPTPVGEAGSRKLVIPPEAGYPTCEELVEED